MVALDTVGRLYDVAIAGVGYMLSDDPAGDTGQGRYQRATQTLQPPEYATGGAAHSQSVDRYQFNQTLNGRNGAGQRFYDHPDSDPQRFWLSQNVDPFSDPDVIRLYPNPDKRLDTTTLSGVPNGLIRIGDKFYTTGTTKVRQYSDAATPVVTDVTVPITPTSICTDGASWYVGGGTGEIYKSTGTTAPVTPIYCVAGGIEALSYAADRLCGWKEDRWTTWTLDGVEEITGGRLGFDDLAGFREGPSVELAGFVYTSLLTPTGAVRFYCWDITDAAPFLALELGPAPNPTSQLAVQIHAFSGALYCSWQQEGSFSRERTVVYRLIPTPEGSLTPTVVAELINGVDVPGPQSGASGQPSPYWANDGRFVYLAYGRYVFTIDPVTGGLCNRHHHGAAMPANALSWSYGALAYGGRLLNLVNDVDEYDVGGFAQTHLEDYNPEVKGFAGSGKIEYSAVDRTSARSKRFDEITVRFRPLPANTTVVVDYTVDDGATWTTLETVSVTGTEVHTEALGVTARELRVRLTLTTSDNVSTPEVLSVEVKSHGLADSDTFVVLPIRCADEQKLLNKANDVSGGPGVGAARVRTLEGLVGTVVNFQDVDWAVGEAEEVVEIESCQLVNRVSTYSTAHGRQRDMQTAILTLRKVG